MQDLKYKAISIFLLGIFSLYLLHNAVPHTHDIVEADGTHEHHHHAVDGTHDIIDTLADLFGHLPHANHDETITNIFQLFKEKQVDAAPTLLAFVICSFDFSFVLDDKAIENIVPDNSFTHNQQTFLSAHSYRGPPSA